jgi:hypothetical protein
MADQQSNSRWKAASRIHLLFSIYVAPIEKYSGVFACFRGADLRRQPDNRVSPSGERRLGFSNFLENLGRHVSQQGDED